jgi:hypothetical protein
VDLSYISCYFRPSDGWNFEVTPGFLENMYTAAPSRLEMPFNEPSVTERSISDECELLTGFCVENMKH